MSSDFNVLVVDDDPIVRALTVRALAREALVCAEAQDGEEASRIASGQYFDLVITDLKMPKQHGHALVRELLALPDPPAIIVLTGVIEPRLARDLLSRGVKQIEYKPVNYVTFAVKARSLLEQKSSASPHDAATQFVWHTLTSAADFVGVSPQTIGKWVKKGLMSTFGKKQRHLRFSVSELEHKQQSAEASRNRLAKTQDEHQPTRPLGTDHRTVKGLEDVPSPLVLNDRFIAE